MNIKSYPSFARLSAWGGRRWLILVLIGLLLTMPADVMHALAVVLHTLYETFAFACEHVLMHGAGLSKFHAQLLVFYTSWIVGLWLLLVLLRRLPLLLRVLWQHGCERCAATRTTWLRIWHQMGIWRKLEIILLQSVAMLGMMLILLS